ncbi:phosphate butyryltransferase [Desulfitispora alkaliphila]|uniref:bifunctional enoyl-CoA hydratase/phosphate acetyltransferase n=1 Tax=Desulfitispora alkaliphila TaxID=622674 RepID=UPI003D207E50
MNFTSFEQVITTARAKGVSKISVANAGDTDIIESIKNACEEKIVEPILVGDQDKIEEIAAQVQFDLKQAEIIHEIDAAKAALTAVEQVSSGKADILMKGSVNSSAFMKAVLDKNVGLRKGNLLSHLAALDISEYGRILYVTDGGINIAPELEQKIEIMENAIEFMHKLGYPEPKVALLSANEVVIPKMKSTEEAALISKMADRKQIKNAVVDGPLSLDLAISLKSVAMKGVESRVAGQAQLLVAPNIETGNVLCKSVVYFANAQIAGVVLGATAPIVMTSRADTSKAKLASIALASLGR